MALRLHDTATREVRDFVPLREGSVGIYLCGLTVQSAPHVGHVRSGVCFDVLRRWLTVRGYAVTFIRNVTDIDDKILAKSAEQAVPWWALTATNKRLLDEAYALLNVAPPTYEPAATGHIPEMLEMVEDLVGRGHAYPAADEGGDVYFDVASWPAYGELTRQRVDDMEAAGDVDPRQAQRKRDPRDFALWKGAKDSEPATASWPSPWGRGRPGWHIECSAMARKYLGDAFDIHGGGVDLRFPHHENEQAQSRAAGQDFASYWLHNAWITTAGEKMSKSLGNSLLVPAVLERVRGPELRYYLVASHYRSQVEFSFEALEEAAAAYRRIEGFLGRAGAPATSVAGPVLDRLPPAFAEALDDDLGTPAAVAVLHDTVREGNRLLAEGADDPGGAEKAAEIARVAGAVRAMLDVLGLDPAEAAWGSKGGDDEAGRLGRVVDTLLAGLLEQRAQARAEKDFATADAIRDRIAAAGLEVTDTPDGSRWSLQEGPERGSG